VLWRLATGSLFGLDGKGGGDILDIGHFVLSDIIPGLLEHLFRFEECDPHGRFAFRRDLEVAGFGVAFVAEDGGEGPVGFAGLEMPDYEEDEVFAEGEDCVVVVCYGHFEVEACELGGLVLGGDGMFGGGTVYFCEMAFGVGVFCSEDGAGGVD